MTTRRIPPAYTLADAVELLGLSNSSVFFTAGLAAHIRQVSRGLYAADDVEEWAERLARRRAWIRLGVLNEKAPLAAAPEDGSYDFVCPQCGGLAACRPPRTAAEMDAWAAAQAGEGEYPAACGQCAWRVG